MRACNSLFSFPREAVENTLQGLLNMSDSPYDGMLILDSSSEDSDSDTEQESTSQTSSPSPKKRTGQKRSAVPDNSEGLIVNIFFRRLLDFTMLFSKVLIGFFYW